MEKKEFEDMLARSGVDLNVFDFYRHKEIDYGQSNCPNCDRQADMHRTNIGVDLTCTKCTAWAEWRCESVPHGLGELGSIQLVRWGGLEPHEPDELDRLLDKPHEPGPLDAG